jgi:hypothetical protein
MSEKTETEKPAPQPAQQPEPARPPIALPRQLPDWIRKEDRPLEEK